MTNLTNLLQEQKKEFDERFPRSNKYEQDCSGEPITTKDFLTTAITKGYELALEEVGRAMNDKKMRVIINGEGREKETRGEHYELGYDDCSFHLSKIIDTHLAHLKKTK